jgi:RHS repeat-associated protein
MEAKVQTFGTLTLKVQKTFEAAGRVATLTYPSGKVVAISYSNGQATAVSVDGVNVASGITYTPFGAPLAWTWGNGTTHTRSFDLHGRMTGHPLGADLRTIGYDDAGRITAVNHFPASGLDQGFGYDDLDRLTQATAGSTTRGYAYDLTGNRAQATVNAATDTYTTAATSNRLSGITGSVTRTMSYDATGSITGDGNLTATYDARGRLRTIRIGAAANTTYTYDGLGQRIRKSGGPAGTVNYVYDEDGRLLGEYNSNGVATREYVWLGDMPLAVLSTTETLRDNTAASTSYVGTWGTASTPTGFYGSNYRTHPAQAASPDSVTWNLATATGTFKVYARWPANGTHSTHAVYRVTHASGTTDVTVNQRLDGAEWVLLGTFSLSSANSRVTLIPQDDGIVAADAVKAVNTSEASRIFFVHADHLNAPRALMNSANQLRWRWTSDPFGLVPPEDNPSGLGAFALNLRLPGQVYDIESNLHYNYFRDYDPSLGRYVQSDPIGLEGGINTYAYVGSNPLLFTDPTGLDYWVEGAVDGELGYGFHQSICVGKRGGKRSCISFGRMPGEGDCWFECKGHVYRDVSAPGPVFRDNYRYTDAATDAKIKKQFDSMVGQRGRWDVLGGKNCREFSQKLFRQLEATYGGKTGPIPK